MKKKDNLIKKICWVGEGFGAFKMVFELAKTKNISLNHSDSRKIPKDYDVYIIHLSEISLEDLKELREEQSWSWIYGYSGASNTKLLDEQELLMKDLNDCLDMRYYNAPSWMYEIDRLKSFLNEIKYPRKESCLK